MKILRNLLTALFTPAAVAQGTISIDLLDQSETTFTIPANVKIVDVFVDILTTDVWTAAGIRAFAENGASFLYHDSDANVPGVQPGLINPGTDDRFTTSLSKPRARDANARFANGAVAVSGGFPQWPNTTPYEFNVTWFASPPETSTSPSVDGFIARIALDVSGVAGAPSSNDAWSIGLAGGAPENAVVVLSCPVFPNGHTPGTIIATWDVPEITGISWELWFVPEPASIAILAAGAMLTLRFARRSKGGRN